MAAADDGEDLDGGSEEGVGAEREGVGGDNHWRNDSAWLLITLALAARMLRDEAPCGSPGEAVDSKKSTPERLSALTDKSASVSRSLSGETPNAPAHVSSVIMPTPETNPPSEATRTSPEPIWWREKSATETDLENAGAATELPFVTGDGMNVKVEGDATGGTSEVLDERSATDSGLGMRVACAGRWNADDGILATKEELDGDKVWIFSASIENGLAQETQITASSRVIRSRTMLMG